MSNKKRAGLESLAMYGFKTTTAVMKDPTELFIKIVEYILDRAPGEYATAEELYNDMTEKFDSVLTIMKDNFERWKKTEAPQLLKTMGIELMDSKDKADFEINDTNLDKNLQEGISDKPQQGKEEAEEEDKGPTLDENFFEDDNKQPERTPRGGAEQVQQRQNIK